MPRKLSKGEQRLLRKMRRLARQQGPAFTRAFEQAYANVRSSLTPAGIASLLEGARSEAFVTSLLDDDTMRDALNPVRAQLVSAAAASGSAFLLDIPGGRVRGGFNVLDPAVLEAVGDLDSKVLGNLAEEIRETLREATRAGIAAGQGSLAIGRRARDAIGLAPNQLRAVDNFKAALEAGDYRKALGYKLRDKRFDRTLQRLVDKGGRLSADQVGRMSQAYERRYRVHNSATHGISAANDVQKLGQHQATKQGIAAGALPADRMMSRWVDSDDSRVREEHALIDGEEVPFDTPFSNGETVPGESTYRCRCVKFDFIGGEEERPEPEPYEQPPFSRSETEEGLRALREDVSFPDMSQIPWSEFAPRSRSGLPFVTDQMVDAANRTPPSKVSTFSVSAAADAQGSVSRYRVEEYLRNEALTDAIDESGFRTDAVVLWKKGKEYLVLEGHHRVAAAMFAGRRHIAARVLGS